MTTAVVEPGGIDVTRFKRPSFGRLARVELRKMADTRSGMWLRAAMGLLAVGAVVLAFFIAPEERTFANFMEAATFPLGLLLPVMGILLVSGEWGQRTTLTTFALEPLRHRVVAAKTVAALVTAMAAAAAATLVAGAATAAAAASHGWDGIGFGMLGGYWLLLTLGILQGLAFGLLLLNSTAAIVLYYLLPPVFAILSNVSSGFADFRVWVDLNSAQSPLAGSMALTGTQWAHLGVAVTVSIVLPFAVGLLRVLRMEIK